MTNNKIYALYHNEQKLEMKITCQKHWEQQREKLEKSTDVIVYWNSDIFLSFSRAALIEKARAIKGEWLEKQLKTISKIANIEIKG